MLQRGLRGFGSFAAANVLAAGWVLHPAQEVPCATPGQHGAALPASSGGVSRCAPASARATNLVTLGSSVSQSTRRSSCLRTCDREPRQALSVHKSTQSELNHWNAQRVVRVLSNSTLCVRPGDALFVAEHIESSRPGSRQPGSNHQRATTSTTSATGNAARPSTCWMPFIGILGAPMQTQA